MAYFERKIIHMNIGWGPPSYRNTPGHLGVVTTSYSFVPPLYSTSINYYEILLVVRYDFSASDL